MCVILHVHVCVRVCVFSQYLYIVLVFCMICTYNVKCTMSCDPYNHDTSVIPNVNYMHELHVHITILHYYPTLLVKLVVLVEAMF